MKININIDSNNIIRVALLSLLVGTYFKINFFVVCALVFGWGVVAINTFLIVLASLNNPKQFFKFDYDAFKARIKDISLVLICFSILCTLWYDWKNLSVFLLLSSFILGKFEFYWRKKK